MTAAMLYRRAIESGVNLRLVEGKVKATGSNEALAELVPQLREHKPELIQFLTDAHDTSARLVAAAMKVCDQHNDNAAAREEMRLDCQNTPVHLRAELLGHFTNSPKDTP